MQTNTRLDDFRKHKDAYFASGEHSPLDHEQRGQFRNLAYFDYEPALQFELTPESAPDQGDHLTLATSDGRSVEFLITGIVRFPVGNDEHTLTLFRDIDRGRLFLPFADQTNGVETYQGGRYLDPQEKPDGTISIDFNYAYNPYCAYSQGWSCPLPPDRNTLPVAIHAGEKSFPLVADSANR